MRGFSCVEAALTQTGGSSAGAAVCTQVSAAAGPSSEAGCAAGEVWEFRRRRGAAAFREKVCGDAGANRTAVPGFPETGVPVAWILRTWWSEGAVAPLSAGRGVSAAV